jgi:hypothetical protein
MFDNIYEMGLKTLELLPNFVIEIWCKSCYYYDYAF